MDDLSHTLFSFCRVLLPHYTNTKFLPFLCLHPTIHPILHYICHTHHHKLVVLGSLLPQQLQLTHLHHPPWRIGDCDVENVQYLVKIFLTFQIIILCINDDCTNMVTHFWCTYPPYLHPCEARCTTTNLPHPIHTETRHELTHVLSTHLYSNHM